MDIEKIPSMVGLIERIKEDKKSVIPSDNRFPIRFIFLNTFKELKELINFLDNTNVKIKELGSFLQEEDSWLTPLDLVNYIKDLSEDTVIVPLSEFLRFQNFNLFYTTIKNLTEIENENLRIYIPLVGLNERFEQDFWSNFHRKDEWAPVWKLETTSKKIHIYQVNYNLDINEIPPKSFELVSSINEWFNIWKKDNIENVISLSKTLSFLCRDCLPDQTFYLDVISNPTEYMENVLGINVSIKFNENEVQYWKKLTRELVASYKKGVNLKEIFLKHFNIRKSSSITIDTIVNLYFRSNDFYDQWLIKNFVSSEDKFKSTYLYDCFTNLNDLSKESLTEKLWLHIFRMPQSSINKKFKERKDLLINLFRQFNFLPSEDKLRIELEKINDYSLKDQFMYITGITGTEKRFILENIKDKDISLIFSDLKFVFPELYYYLNWDLIKPDNFVDNWIIKYFKNYNISKVTHSKSVTLGNLINDKNKSKSTFSEWFYSIPKPKIEEDSNCIWVDGLGVEWFPLMIYLINKYGSTKGKYVKTKLITRANLPSITKCNKHQFDKIEDLDNYIHREKSYEYPSTLLEEIEIIKGIVKKILNKSFEKISIISDHGFSFLCLKDFGNIKKLYFKDSEHNGRCMKTDKDYNDDYYFVWTPEEGDCQDDKFVVASKHVSLNNTPRTEVHGGATPEEVLVPYILIETRENKVDYTIEPSEFVISVSDPKIEFEIIPSTSNIPEASVNGKVLNLIKEKDVYKLNLKFLRAGEHIIDLKIGTKHFELKLKVKGGFKERDLI